MIDATNDLIALVNALPEQAGFAVVMAAAALVFAAIALAQGDGWTHATPKPRFRNRRLELLDQRERRRGEALRAQREQERQP